jgi:hypothetical protein
MRIISDFHDYYDIASAYSPTPLYLRRTERLAPERVAPLRDLLHLMPIPQVVPVNRSLRQQRVTRIDKFLVGFCGRIYLGYQVILGSAWDTNHETQYHYDFAKLVQALPYDQRGLKCKKTDTELLKQWESFYQNHRALLDNKDVAPFVELGVPIFATLPVTEYRWSMADIKFQTNPKLRDYGFVTQLDPFTAYQEIEMFVGGVLTNREEIPPLTQTDTDKAVTKGFDKQWSFRRHSEESKKPRRRGRV